MVHALGKRGKIQWMPDHIWNLVRRYVPIPCIDVLLENSEGETLLGWRRIPPYRNVWALPGGRLLKGERLEAAASRILADYDLSARQFFQVGVFPIRCPSRSDVSVCIAGLSPMGKAIPDGREFSSFRWTKQLPPKLGTNYRRMITRWHKMKSRPQALRFARL